MRHVYFDASVLVKAYVLESGTRGVRNLLHDALARPPRARISTSRVSLVEAMSAVARRESARELDGEEADRIGRQLVAHFMGRLRPYAVIGIDRGVVARAAELVRRHRLRAIDALHLATGLAARESVPEGQSFHFGSADHRLSLAAAHENLAVFDPR